MSAFSRRHARTLVVVLMIVAAVVWVPSFLSAEHYRRALVARLEQMLGRRVDFESASFNLIPRPGFSLHKVVVEEDPQFGTEPFARIDEVECDLGLRRLWRGHLDFVGLRLVGATVNIVRNTRGEWNVESLLRRRGVAAAGPAAPVLLPAPLELDADQARLNFKIGVNKKPFAITDLQARLNFDPAARAMRFRLTGFPIRTDSSLPSPGVLSFTGTWKPADDLAGSLDATLETRGAMLYDWIPLVSGRDLGIYGVLRSSVHLSGGLRLLHVDGEARLEQVHRWESLPPSGNLPVEFRFRGQFDRAHGRAVIDDLDGSFAGSSIHIAGSLSQIPTSPRLDLTIVLDRSRVDDFLEIGRRLIGATVYRFGLDGRVDGVVRLRGPWNTLDAEGSITAHDARLNTPSRTYPLSLVVLRLGTDGIRLEPVRITIAPHVAVTAEASIGRLAEPASAQQFSLIAGRSRRARILRFPSHRARRATPGRYELSLAATSAPIAALVNFASSIGLRTLESLNAQGMATVDFNLSGQAWPFTKPAVSGQAELLGTRLHVPGIDEPVELSRARLQVNGGRVILDPFAARVGTSVFAGRLEHEGDHQQPWRFDIRADSLSLNQAAGWFDAIGHRSSLRLLDFLPGLRPLAARLAAGSSLLGAVDAAGRFLTPELSYGNIRLGDFQAAVAVSKRIVRVSSATFRAAGGRGEGRAEIDLSSRPASIELNLALEGAKLQTWALALPDQLRRTRGLLSGSVRLETRGLTREVLASNLQGTADVHLKNVDFGGFDPLRTAARAGAFGRLNAARGSVTLPSADITLSIRNRRVALASNEIRIAGGLFDVGGTYDFDGALALEIRADLRQTTRRWLDSDDPSDPLDRTASFQLAGHLDNLALVPAPGSPEAHR